MASLVKNRSAKGITYYVQLSPGEHEARPKISLGKCTRRNAETARIHIANLVNSDNTGSVVEPETQKWIAKLRPVLRKRLETLELIEPLKKKECFTVTQWCDRYISLRKGDKCTKADTVRKLQNTADKLKAFFRTDRLDEVNRLAAKSFR